MANSTIERPKITQILKTPGVSGGEACVGNTRIAVWMLVAAKRDGVNDSQLLEEYYPNVLSPADLGAAWKYERDHPAEIDAAIRLNEAE